MKTFKFIIANIHSFLYGLIWSWAGQCELRFFDGKETVLIVAIEDRDHIKIGKSRIMKIFWYRGFNTKLFKCPQAVTFTPCPDYHFDIRSLTSINY